MWQCQRYQYVLTSLLYALLCNCVLTEACAASEPPNTNNDQSVSSVLAGEQLFIQPFSNTNGRSCATCHVPEDSFTLSPAHVVQLWKTNPNDPLFNSIDADDPKARKLTFEHLKKGLVRVWLTLPENVDVISSLGNVVTPTDRRIFVWRSVPSLADSALTAPYQLDGRATTLEQQAQSAIISHSEGGEVSQEDLERIAEFVRSIYSSERSRKAVAELESGTAVKQVSDVDSLLVLSPAEKRGREVYNAVCASCHGGANKATIVDRTIHDLAFPALKPDGTVQYKVPATNPPTALLASQPDNEFINIGTAMENFIIQLGAPTDHKDFTKELSFPSYRLRFYKDATRKEIIATLPPAIRPGSLNFPGKLLSNKDRDGNPIVGPNFFFQLYSTDPGRAIITGSPYDFEAFDIPTLRGIGKTGPYFHNNISETLEDVVNLYSDHLLSRFPSLTLPGEKEIDPDGDIGPPEALTAEQKKDLVSFLKRL